MLFAQRRNLGLKRLRPRWSLAPHELGLILCMGFIGGAFPTKNVAVCKFRYFVCETRDDHDDGRHGFGWGDATMACGTFLRCEFDGLRALPSHRALLRRDFLRRRGLPALIEGNGLTVEKEKLLGGGTMIISVARLKVG